MGLNRTHLPWRSCNLPSVKTRQSQAAVEAFIIIIHFSLISISWGSCKPWIQPWYEMSQCWKWLSTDVDIIIFFVCGCTEPWIWWNSTNKQTAHNWRRVVKLDWQGQLTISYSQMTLRLPLSGPSSCDQLSLETLVALCVLQDGKTVLQKLWNAETVEWKEFTGNKK